MNMRLQENASRDFLIGLMSGSAIGAGIAMLFAPRPPSKLRRRLTVSATDLGIAAPGGHHGVTARAADVVDTFTRQRQAVRDDVADEAELVRASSVGRGAREVEQFATALTNHTA
jgi:gas vesicle protein